MKKKLKKQNYSKINLFLVKINHLLAKEVRLLNTIRGTEKGSIRQPYCNEDGMWEIFFCTIWHVSILILLIDFPKYSQQRLSNQIFSENWDGYLGLAAVKELIIQIFGQMTFSSMFVTYDISKIETPVNYKISLNLKTFIFRSRLEVLNGIFIFWFTYPSCCTKRLVNIKAKTSTKNGGYNRKMDITAC